MVRKHRYNSVLTVREVAQFLNIHVNTVRRWSDLGIPRPLRCQSCRTRWARRDVGREPLRRRGRRGRRRRTRVRSDPARPLPRVAAAVIAAPAGASLHGLVRADRLPGLESGVSRQDPVRHRSR